MKNEEKRVRELIKDYEMNANEETIINMRIIYIEAQKDQLEQKLKENK